MTPEQARTDYAMTPLGRSEARCPCGSGWAMHWKGKWQRRQAERQLRNHLKRHLNTHDRADR